MPETPSAMEAARRLHNTYLCDDEPHCCLSQAQIAAALDAYAAERLVQHAYMPDPERCLNCGGPAGDPRHAESLAAMRIGAIDWAEACEAERDIVLARAEAAESCTTCDGQPHASGKVCICGGSGRRADETQNLREGLQASQAQVAELDDMIAAHFLFHHDNKKDPPADLLEAVQFIVSVADAHAIRTGIDFPTHRAALTRYGLLPAAPVEDARP